jgi:hypothetical protein
MHFCRLVFTGGEYLASGSKYNIVANFQKLWIEAIYSGAWPIYLPPCQKDVKN